jgi:hypothetical protein
MEKAMKKEEESVQKETRETSKNMKRSVSSSSNNSDSESRSRGVNRRAKCEKEGQAGGGNTSEGMESQRMKAVDENAYGNVMNEYDRSRFKKTCKETS